MLIEKHIDALGYLNKKYQASGKPHSLVFFDKKIKKFFECFLILLQIYYAFVTVLLKISDFVEVGIFLC